MDPNADVAKSADVRRASSSALLRLPIILSLILALIAGGILVGVVIAWFPIFLVPSELMAMFPPEPIARAREASIKQTAMLNATVALGILGVLMTVLLGAGEAAARRFADGTVARLVVGVVLGTAVACASAVVGQLLAQTLYTPEPSLSPIVLTFIVQACMLGLFGLGVGAALGFVAGGARTAGVVAMSGLIAGIVAAFVYPVASTFLTPSLQTEFVMPGGVLRGQKHTVGLVLYLGLLVVSLGLILPLASRGTSAKPAA